MKIFVKTLRGTDFEIEVKPEDMVVDVKKSIETTKGADTYPAVQQMLIHQGKILKDGTTLEENKVAENSFVVIMLTKNKGPSGEDSTTSSAPSLKAPQTSAPPTASTPVATSPPPVVVPAPAPAPAPAPVPASNAVSDIYDQAASNLVAGDNLEVAIQQILDVVGGTWDRDTVVRALHAAYNNPESAVEYLYSGIPESAEAPPISQSMSSGQAANVRAQPQQPAEPAPFRSAGPNANPLNLFPQGPTSVGSNAADGTTLNFLHNSPQFQALRAMVQANPQILQPMLQELGKQNPQLMTLMQENQADFLRLINEPVGGEEGDVLEQQAGAIPQAITVTPEELESIERIEAMGFDRTLVLEVFFACNKNEELAANYLLDHIHEFQE